MISHQHKCIFVHIPKTAGMSIYNFFYSNVNFYQNIPNYDILFGWCPKRRLHMQHATAKQLLETELVTEEQWNSYYKFTFVRNPWDRAYSDYLYIQKFSGIHDTFKNFISRNGHFKTIMIENKDCNYMGDHLELQSSFFDDSSEKLKLNFVGRFENFQFDMNIVLQNLNINELFDIKTNQSNKRLKHYSSFYTDSKKEFIESIYKKDIEAFNYSFEDNRKGIYYLKRYF